MECCNWTVGKETLNDSVEQTKSRYSISYWLNMDPVLFSLNKSVDVVARQVEHDKINHMDVPKRTKTSDESSPELCLMYRTLYNQEVNTDKENTDREKGSVMNQIDKLFFKNRDSDCMSNIKQKLTQIRGSLTNRQPTMEVVEKGKKNLQELMYYYWS